MLVDCLIQLDRGLRIRDEYGGAYILQNSPASNYFLSEDVTLHNLLVDLSSGCTDVSRMKYI